ncbi:MAG TPA: hypothetical protein VIU87_00050 [Mycobacterium sp.]
MFNARLRPRLTVVGPGLPVGVAQETTDGAIAKPAPNRMLERSIDLREKRRSDSQSVIIDLLIRSSARSRAAR